MDIITASLTTAAVYLAVEFVWGLTDRLHRQPSTVDTVTAPSPEPIAPSTSRPKPSSVGAMAIDFEAMNAKELRRECTARGHKWRDIHGKNRHATRAQMLAMLAG